MSASLVGSEMCIRDSYTRTEYMLGYLPLYVGMRLMIFDKLCASLGPVTYTHLTLPTICSV
eukprot:7919319-Alexandrium_andersonii.AAC.1